MTGPPELTARRYTAAIPVSCCELTDNTGVNYCEHPQPAQPSRWRLRRWALADRWALARLRLGAWIAGIKLDDLEDE